ncbi:MAG TPA: ferrochelatase [Gemmatimonadaceae bacterium]|nr:ferrochelatase [Gemmatimonadaceae bacterium]
MNDRIGVLLMAYGGPSSLDDLPGYLADVRRGRSTPRTIVDELAHNYASIGGRSPLNMLTQAQADAVSRALDTRSPSLRFAVHVGMRHWSPWIEETVGSMLDAGITRAVSLVLAPHFSAMSVAAYQARIAAGLDAYRGEIEFVHVDSYHAEPALIQAFADRVHEGIDRWEERERESVHVVFSAHSLPQRIIAAGDPYDRQVRETAALIASRAGLDESRWSWSYQSAGRTSEPWLGPTLPDHLTALARAGVRNVVSVPVGFVCDHVEILYDIDVAAQACSRELGIRLERPAALNDDPRFIELLAGLIQQRAASAGWMPD